MLITSVVLSLTEYVGVKTALILASIPGMVGAFLIALGYNGLSMVAGRALTGVYLSFCFTGLPVYFVEIAKPSDKKLFGAMVPLMFRFSLLLLYTLGIWVHYTWLAVILLAIIAFMSLNLVFLPESPNWLRQKGMVARAESAIRYFYDPPVTETDTDTDTQEVSDNPPGNISTYFTWIIIRPMLVSLTIQMAVSCATHSFSRPIQLTHSIKLLISTLMSLSCSTQSLYCLVPVYFCGSYTRFPGKSFS